MANKISFFIGVATVIGIATGAYSHYYSSEKAASSDNRLRTDPDEVAGSHDELEESSTANEDKKDNHKEVTTNPHGAEMSNPTTEAVMDRINKYKGSMKERTTKKEALYCLGVATIIAAIYVLWYRDTPTRNKLATLGITNLEEWSYIMPNEDFAKRKEYTVPLILALRYGEVIYQNSAGEIYTSEEDIAIIPNAVLSQWKYKELVCCYRCEEFIPDHEEITHRYTKGTRLEKGTGLRFSNINWLECKAEKYKKHDGQGIAAIIISTGMHDRLGAHNEILNDVKHYKKVSLRVDHKEGYVLNSAEVPAKYLEMVKKYGGRTSVLLHIKC